MKTTNNFLTKTAIARKKRNTAICYEFSIIMQNNPEASVMVVRDRLADKYNMSASSIANIIHNGRNKPQRQER